MAQADSACETPTGAFPCTGKRFPAQQLASSGRPNGSSLLILRRQPRQALERSALPPSRKYRSTIRGKFASKKRGRSTCSPKSDPYTSTAWSAISLAAPLTFSIAVRRPVEERNSRVRAIRSSAFERPPTSIVEYCLHGGLAMITTGSTRRTCSVKADSRVASTTAKASSPNHLWNAGWSTTSDPKGDPLIRLTPSASPPAAEKGWYERGGPLLDNRR